MTNSGRFRIDRIAFVLSICLLASAVALVGCGSSEADVQDESLPDGRVAYENADFETAQEEFEQAVDIDPEDAEALFLLGQTYEAQGDLDAAADAYKRSLRADISQSRVQYNLAIILKSQGDIDEAIENLEIAIRIDSEFVGARLALGDIYAESGNAEDARTEYETVLEMEPFGLDLDDVRRKLDAL